MSLSEAWRIYDDLIADPRIAFAPEPPGLDPIWRGYTQGSTFSPQVWNDAYLAAFAEAVGFKLITFDKGFARYRSLNADILAWVYAVCHREAFLFT